MEMLLVILLIAAVGYIVYLGQQPKTDKERKKRDDMRERMVKTKEIQAKKDARRAQDESL
jgi:Tfp pilus assembly protein PilO